MDIRHVRGAGLALCAGVFVWAVPGAAPAQAQDAEAPRFETEVVVTPERGETPRSLVPAATVVLEGEALPALPVVQLNEAVALLPGFTFQQAQPWAVKPLVSARGFFGGGEAEYVRLLVDGVPVGDAETGLIDWTLVPVSAIRRIEALRGPGASMYGDAAVGGVVQVFTDRGDAGQFSVSGGSFDSFTGDAAWGRRLASLGVMVSVAGATTDGASAHAGGRRAVAGGALDGRVGAATWRWTLNGSNRHQEDPGPVSAAAAAVDPFASDPVYRFDETDRASVATGFTAGHAGGVWQHQVRLDASRRSEDLVRTILLAPGLGDRQARDLTTTAVGGSVESSRSVAVSGVDLLVRAGLDVAREGVETAYRAVDGNGAAGAAGGAADGRRLRAGAFVSSAWDVTARVRLSAGVRWDRVGDEFAAGAATQVHQAWSPRVGATVQLGDAQPVTLFAQVARAFKTPTLDQLFDPRPYPDFRGGSFTISSTDLVPQRATNLEAGLMGGGDVRWSALAYYMTVDDEIDFDVRTFSYANIGESRHVGLEVEAGAPLAWPVRPAAAYALSRVTRPDDGRQLKNVPRHVFTLSADADLPAGLGAHVWFRRTAGAFLDDANGLPIDGAATVDLRVRGAVGAATLFLDVLNLADDRYDEYGFTLTGFTGETVPYDYPGAPRALRVGVTLPF
jgi:iron complex outermembrane receptor protein